MLHAGIRRKTAPTVSLVRRRFACREVALRSNPAAGASPKGRTRGRLSAESGLGFSGLAGSRLDEGAANVSLRATFGFALRRHAHRRLSIDTAGATSPRVGKPQSQRRERVVSPRPVSRVIGDRSKTAPQPSRAASAMSTRTAIGKPPRTTSRLTGDRQPPTDAGDRKRCGGGAVFPRGEWEQDTTRSRRVKRQASTVAWY